MSWFCCNSPPFIGVYVDDVCVSVQNAHTHSTRLVCPVTCSRFTTWRTSVVFFFADLLITQERNTESEPEQSTARCSWTGEIPPNPWASVLRSWTMTKVIGTLTQARAEQHWLIQGKIRIINDVRRSFIHPPDWLWPVLLQRRWASRFDKERRCVLNQLDLHIVVQMTRSHFCFPSHMTRITVKNSKTK